MQELIITVGISGCGKSTYANTLKVESGFVEVNRDNIRASLYHNSNELDYGLNYKFTKAKEEKVTACQEKAVEQALQSGWSVVISDTNLKQDYVNKWKAVAEKHGVKFTVEYLDVPLHVCQQRNLKRARTVPPKVLLQQAKAMRVMMGKPVYEGTPDKPHAVIFDVDGTLADMQGIRSAFEWDKVGLDKPRYNVINLARMLELEGYTILVMSGRDGVCRSKTWDWLEKHDIPFEKLYQRKEGDCRPDAVIKEELFWKWVAPNYDVRFVVDDRNQMVDAWRLIGLECWQVQEGDF